MGLQSICGTNCRLEPGEGAHVVCSDSHVTALPVHFSTTMHICKAVESSKSSEDDHHALRSQLDRSDATSAQLASIIASLVGSLEDLAESRRDWQEKKTKLHKLNSFADRQLGDANRERLEGYRQEAQIAGREVEQSRKTVCDLFAKLFDQYAAIKAELVKTKASEPSEKGEKIEEQAPPTSHEIFSNDLQSQKNRRSELRTSEPVNVEEDQIEIAVQPPVDHALDRGTRTASLDGMPPQLGDENNTRREEDAQSQSEWQRMSRIDESAHTYVTEDTRESRGTAEDDDNTTDAPMLSLSSGDKPVELNMSTSKEIVDIRTQLRAEYDAKLQTYIDEQKAYKAASEEKMSEYEATIAKLSSRIEMVTDACMRQKDIFREHRDVLENHTEALARHERFVQGFTAMLCQVPSPKVSDSEPYPSLSSYLNSKAGSPSN